jgi:ABC-2 type transport system permease protein
MNIFIREFKANLKSLIIWAILLVLIVYGASFEFEAFVGNASFMEVMESFSAIFTALGIPFSNLSEPEGFVSLMSIYFYIPLSIYAAMLGSSIISKEERDKTAEYLFTLPVTRHQVLTSKVIVVFINNIILNLILVAGTILVYLRFSPSEAFFNFMIYLSIGLIFTQIVFLAIGMFLAAVLKQYKKSSGVTVGIVMGSYLLFVLIGLSDKIDFLKYFTPFKYFEVADMQNGNIRIEFVIISAAIAIAGVAGLFYFYRRRDLYI